MSPGVEGRWFGRHLFNPAGRMSPGQFWPHAAKTYLGMMAACILVAMFNKYALDATGNDAVNAISIALFFGAVVIGNVLLAVAAARRLHDIERAGAWVLVAFIPLGVLVLLYWLIKTGTVGPNRFGPAPGV